MSLKHVATKFETLGVKQFEDGHWGGQVEIRKACNDNVYELIFRSYDSPLRGSSTLSKVEYVSFEKCQKLGYCS